VYKYLHILASLVAHLPTHSPTHTHTHTPSLPQKTRPRSALFIRAIRYALKTSRPGVAELIREGVTRHLHSCRHFDHVNTMDPTCNETKKIDAFVCDVIKAIFSCGDAKKKTLWPLHAAARLVETNLAASDGADDAKLSTLRSFYGRAIITLVEEAIDALKPRTNGLSRIIKRALKHAFASNVVEGSKLIGLCEGFQRTCERIDELMIGAIEAADLGRAVASESRNGVPLAHSAASWPSIRKSALRVLAVDAADATPSRPVPRSDTIPYYSANHLRLALDAIDNADKV
jgi:hypothetical protein